MLNRLRLRQIEVDKRGDIDAHIQFKLKLKIRQPLPPRPQGFSDFPLKGTRLTAPDFVSTIKKWCVLILEHVIADFRGVGWGKELEALLRSPTCPRSVPRL